MRHRPDAALRPLHRGRRLVHLVRQLTGSTRCGLRALAATALAAATIAGCGGPSTTDRPAGVSAGPIDGRIARGEYVAAVHAVRRCMREASLSVSPLRLSIIDGVVLEYDVEIGSLDPDEVSRVSTECEDRHGADVIASYSEQTFALREALARRRFVLCGIKVAEPPAQADLDCLLAATPQVAPDESDQT